MESTAVFFFFPSNHVSDGGQIFDGKWPATAPGTDPTCVVHDMPARLLDFSLILTPQ